MAELILYATPAFVSSSAIGRDSRRLAAGRDSVGWVFRGRGWGRSPGGNGGLIRD